MEIWQRNLFENIHLQNQEENGKLTSRQTLVKAVVSVGGGWNWLGTCSVVGFSISDVEPFGPATGELVR
jgi:hypothetical protein